MNDLQRKHWENIRNKGILGFLSKYIILFYFPVFVLVILIFLDRGIVAFYNELKASAFLDLIAFVFVFFGWAFLGFSEGNKAWKTWEKEYIGEKAFAEKPGSMAVASTGLTNNPYKDLWAKLYLIMLMIGCSTFLVLKLLNLSVLLNDASNFFVLLKVLFGVSIFLILFVGFLIGIFLWILTLRPFYNYQEIIKIISFSNNHKNYFSTKYITILTAFVDFIYKSGKN